MFYNMPADNGGQSQNAATTLFTWIFFITYCSCGYLAADERPPPDICSIANNPCLTALETSPEFNFIFGLTKNQLYRACEIFVKSMHCLDYKLDYCSTSMKDLAKSHVQSLRVTMDRICHDQATKKAYLDYSRCFKNAYSRTEYCMRSFLGSLQDWQNENNMSAAASMISHAQGNREPDPTLFLYLCKEWLNMTICVHEAVPCSTKSSRDIKDVLNLMLRGGIPAWVIQHCDAMGINEYGRVLNYRSTGSASVRFLVYERTFTWSLVPMVLWGAMRYSHEIL